MTCWSFKKILIPIILKIYICHRKLYILKIINYILNYIYFRLLCSWDENEVVDWRNVISSTMHFSKNAQILSPLTKVRTQEITSLLDRNNRRARGQSFCDDLVLEIQRAGACRHSQKARSTSSSPFTCRPYANFRIRDRTRPTANRIQIQISRREGKFAPVTGLTFPRRS